MKTGPAERPARPAGASISEGLAKQQRDREKTLRRIVKLRKKAAAEVERLLTFLDACDPYAATELEDGNDDEPSLGFLDGSPGSGRSGVSPGYDLEGDDCDLEPSLGSSGHGEAGAISYAVRAISDGCQMVYDCEGDEHDGREPDVDDEPSLCGVTVETSGDDRDLEGPLCDDEPSLGWTDQDKGLWDKGP